MRIITIILLFLFYPNLYANEKVVLECFSLTGDYEFKYYGIEQDDLFYINKKRKVTKIPYDAIKIKGKTMYAETPEDSLSFTLWDNVIEVKRSPKEGKSVRYGCSTLSGRSLVDFINK